MSRSRNYIFTHNNYVDTVLEDTIECAYIAYSHEVAPTSGTPHLQGFVHWVNAKTLSAAIKLLPGCHVEQMRGSIGQNVTYCSKVELLVERGVRPLCNDDKGRANALRYQQTWDFAKAGDIESIDADMKIRHYKTLKAISSDYQISPENLPNQETCGIWLYGPPGTGKTRAVVDQFPDHYEKMPNKWWDNYSGEEVVFMDEFDLCHVKELVSSLKSWADFKKFRAEIKGGSILIRPKKFIICSNHHLNELLPTNSSLYVAVARRFKFLYKGSLSDIVCL